MYTDLTGKRFGNIVVLEFAFKDKNYRRHWKCKCDCGNILYPSENNLKSGNTWRCKECGYKSTYSYELVGKRFGKYVVTKIISHNPIMCECHCDCGNVKIVRADDLRSSKIVSCGCYKSSQTTKRQIIHGESGSRLYRIYENMLTRCNNPKSSYYHVYGGRGIKVCKEWENSPQAFFDWAKNNGYDNNLSIDRIDNDKGYCPSNCRWATVEEQAQNKRNTIYLEYKGERKTIYEWSKETGLSATILRRRIRDGWSAERAIETPKLKNKCPKSVQ